MLIRYNWPNKTKLLWGMPVFIERCEFISKMFSFALYGESFGDLNRKNTFCTGKMDFFPNNSPISCYFSHFRQNYLFPIRGLRCVSSKDMPIVQRLTGYAVLTRADYPFLECGECVVVLTKNIHALLVSWVLRLIWAHWSFHGSLVLFEHIARITGSRDLFDRIDLWWGAGLI